MPYLLGGGVAGAEPKEEGLLFYTVDYMFEGLVVNINCNAGLATAKLPSMHCSMSNLFHAPSLPPVAVPGVSRDQHFYLGGVSTFLDLDHLPGKASKPARAKTWPGGGPRMNERSVPGTAHTSHL